MDMIRVITRLWSVQAVHSSRRRFAAWLNSGASTRNLVSFNSYQGALRWQMKLCQDRLSRLRVVARR